MREKNSFGAMRSLRRRSDFLTVYEEGVKRVGNYLVLYLLPAEDDARAVVATKKLGSAVKRNRAKRLLREALSDRLIGRPGVKAQIFRRFFPIRNQNEASKDQACGLWIVAIARNRILTAKSADLRNEVQQLLQLN
jgi:ribonuclease P protein component